MDEEHANPIPPNEGCPSLEVLEAIVLNRPDGDSNVEGASAATRAHVASCASCRRRIDEMRRENDFIACFAGVKRRHSETTVARSVPDETTVELGCDTFPGYVIRDVLAVGGQGVVYRAEQSATGRLVVIKVPVHDAVRRPAKRYRFQREVELTARLHHPAVVNVLGVCEAADGRIGCVMEFVDGVRFDDWAAEQRTQGRAGVRRLVVAVRDVAAAIAHAHQNAVLHRDIKPGNVIVMPDGAPRVLDFGLAKTLDEGMSSFATITGAFLGTLAYAAPEQVARSGQATDASTDVRTDVHGLGLLLYTGLTGAPPWSIDAPADELLRSIRELTPPRPTHDLPAPDSELDAIVLKAIAKDKARRYQSADAFARDLQCWLDGDPVQARLDSRWYVIRKKLWRNRRLIVVAGILVVALASAAFMAFETLTVRRFGAMEQARADAEALRVRAFAELMRSIAPSAELTSRDLLSHPIVMNLYRVARRLELSVYERDPQYEAALRTTLGSVVSVSPQFAGMGEIYVRDALTSRISRYGPEHPEVATGWHELAVLLLERKRYPEALKYATQAAELRQRHYGPEDAFTVASIEARARARLGLGDAEGAVADIEALQSSIGLEAPPPLRATVLGTAAEAYAATGAADLAWSAASDALLVSAAHLVEDDPILARTLATAARVAADRPGEVPAFARAFGVSEWPALAAKLAELSDGLVDHSAPSAQPRSLHLERLVALRRELLGPEHPAVGVALATLGWQHQLEWHHERAAASFKEAIPILRKSLGPSHPALGNLHSNIALMLSVSGPLTECVDHLRQSIAVYEAQPAPTHDEQTIASLCSLLARFEALAGMHEAALLHGREAMSRLERLFGTTHHAYGMAMCITAWSLSALDRRNESEALARAGWRIVSESPATPSDQHRYAEALYGLVLSRCGREHEGRPHLIAGLEAWMSNYEIEPPGFEIFFEELANGHRRHGDEESARAVWEWRSRLQQSHKAARLQSGSK